MSDPLLKVENLFCERDERILFDNLSFTLSAGQILQVEGQNGSGKTTLLKIISGLSRHYEGDIFWRGEAVSRQRERYHRELLYFGHQPSVKAVLTAEENLRWSVALGGAEVKTVSIRQALHQVGLEGFEDVPCHMLSAGQNRRVSLARLYLSQAPLWILDEPFTAIDKRGVAAQEALLSEHVARGGCVLMTTHQELSLTDRLSRINLDQRVGTS